MATATKMKMTHMRQNNHSQNKHQHKHKQDQNQNQNQNQSMMMTQSPDHQILPVARMPPGPNNTSNIPFQPSVTVPSFVHRQPNTNGTNTYTHHNNMSMQHTPSRLSTTTFTPSPTNGMQNTDTSRIHSILDDLVLQRVLQTHPSSVHHNPLVSQYHPHQYHNIHHTDRTNDVLRMLRSEAMRTLPSRSILPLLANHHVAPHHADLLNSGMAMYRNATIPSLNGAVTTHQFLDKQRRSTLTGDWSSRSVLSNGQLPLSIGDIEATCELLRLAAQKDQQSNHPL